MWQSIARSWDCSIIHLNTVKQLARSMLSSYLALVQLPSWNAHNNFQIQSHNVEHMRVDLTYIQKQMLKRGGKYCAPSLTPSGRGYIYIYILVHLDTMDVIPYVWVCRRATALAQIRRKCQSVNFKLSGHKYAYYLRASSCLAELCRIICECDGRGWSGLCWGMYVCGRLRTPRKPQANTTTHHSGRVRFGDRDIFEFHKPHTIVHLSDLPRISAIFAQPLFPCRHTFCGRGQRGCHSNLASALAHIYLYTATSDSSAHEISVLSEIMSSVLENLPGKSHVCDCDATYCRETKFVSARHNVYNSINI